MPISARAAIQKRIDKIQMALANLHSQASDIFGAIEANEFAMQELQAVLKSLPDEEGSEAPTEIALRRGSDASQARDRLRDVRKPLHVDALLTMLGKPITKKTRASLAGQLAFYARKNQIFSKTGPNEFGLLEWTDKSIKVRPDGSVVVGNPLSDTFEIHIPVGEGEENTNGHKAKESAVVEPVALSLDDD